MAPPRLPAAEVRAALDAGEWDLANRLLGAHQCALHDALARTDFNLHPVAPWRELLAAQRMLEAELHAAREQVARQLEKLDSDRRGTRAWMRELA